MEKDGADKILDHFEVEDIAKLVHRLTDNILSDRQLKAAIRNEKRIVEMREDPDHESWMELR